MHLAGSEEEEEDCDDDEEAEKEQREEHEKETAGEEEQIVVAVEPEPAATEQDSQEGCMKEKSKGAEEEVELCGRRKPENESETQSEKGRGDKAVTDLSGQSHKKDKLSPEGQGENIGANAVSDNRAVNAEMGREYNAQKVSETVSEKSPTVRQEDNSSDEVASAEESKKNIHTEPMEVEATESGEPQTSTTEPSGAGKGEEDTGTG